MECTRMGGKKWMMVFVLGMVLVAGCSSPAGGASYALEVHTDGRTAVYIPAPVDDDTGDVADLVSELRVVEKEGGAEVEYGVVETRYGEAIRIDTGGNVTLRAEVNGSYFDQHPVQSQGGGFPHFFNLTMRSDERGEFLYYHAFQNASGEDGSVDGAEVRIRLGAVSSRGGETWSTKNESGISSEVELRDGWQTIRMGHSFSVS